MFDAILKNELLKLNEKLSNERLEICYSCPLFLKKNGGVCNSKLWINVNTGETSSRPKAGYKNGCGCMIHSKVKSTNSKCPIGKW